MTLSNNDIPPPPEKPTPQECCGSGCVPCIYDYYYDNLEQWEQQYGVTLQEYEDLKKTF